MLNASQAEAEMCKSPCCLNPVYFYIFLASAVCVIDLL